jgi:hypothetical protein
MIELFKQVYEVFLLYIADGWHFITFAALFVFLWITEKNKNVRVVLLYLTAAVLFLFFFPVTAYVAMRLMGEVATYYRILWFAPITLIIAYGIVKFVSSRNGKMAKILAAILSALVIIAGGDFVYDNDFFQTTKNYHQLPPTVIAICDEIEVEGREVKAAFPKELMEYVRQYSATVHMPYGREMLVGDWLFYSELYDVMNGEVVAPELLTTLARQENCHYIILAADKVDINEMETYKYTLYRQIGGYNVYLDSTAYLGLFDEE